MKSGTRIVLVVLALVAGFGAIGFVTYFNRIRPGRTGLVTEVVRSKRPVRTLPVAPRELQERLERSGVLEARRDVFIAAEVPGTVRKIHKELGDRCSSGEALAQLGADGYAAATQQAHAALAQALVGRTQAEQDLARVKELEKHGAIAAQELERATNALGAANAAAQQAQAAARLAQRSLSDSTLRCPFDGVVAQRLARVGQLVGPQMPLYRLVDLAELKLSVRVNASELSRLREGQPVVLRDSADVRLAFAAKVSRLGVAADPGTHTFPVEITVAGDQRGARPGQVVRAAIVVAEHRSVLAVPEDAIRAFADGPSVFVARGGRAERVAVQLGARIGIEVIVTRGLAAGDQVIVLGQDALGPGDPVEVVNPQPSASPVAPAPAPVVSASYN